MKTKFIFVTGGVVSGLGKGVAASSIGRLLESHGLRIALMKCDPYLNVDPGTMSPFQHGEVYVTEDGAETDLDLGHYERFTSALTSRANNWTAGRIYESILRRERKGDFLGKTVQVIPHVTDEISKAITSLAESNDVVIVEIGGTVGDIESLPFLEACRQMRLEHGREHTLFVHLTLVPYITSSGELKTKPTQHSVKELRAIGIQPDILLCRTDRFLTADLKRKIALFTNVPLEAVITAKDVNNIYEVPIIFAGEHLDLLILKQLGLKPGRRELGRWRSMLQAMNHPRGEVHIALVGKYAGLHDSYISLRHALLHGATAHKLRLKLSWIEAEDLERGKPEKILGGADGILVPGGFGVRGIEGKIRAVTHARRNRVPYFGICLGMQCATIEFARNVAGLKGAHSTEFDSETPHKIFFMWREIRGVKDMGGTMRLGGYDCLVARSSKAYKAYKKYRIIERHRHRYEFNPEFRRRLEAAGLVVSGVNPEHELVEIVELPDHPWFLGCQFHPEFKSKPLAPHPLFRDFIGASYAHRLERSRPRARG